MLAMLVELVAVEAGSRAVDARAHFFREHPIAKSLCGLQILGARGQCRLETSPITTAFRACPSFEIVRHGPSVKAHRREVHARLWRLDDLKVVGV